LRNIYDVCLRAVPGFFLALLLTSTTLFAYPSAEKATLSLASAQATSMIMKGDRYLFLGFSNTILRIDTETFAATSAQVPALVDNTGSGGKNLSGDVAGLVIRSNTLFASQADGDLITIDLDSITSAPSTTNLVSGALGPLVADTETGTDDDKLYILDKKNNAVIVYDISSATQTRILLFDSFGVAVAPVAVIFDPFPTTSSSSATDKIFITSNRGLVFVLDEGGTGISATIALSTTNKDLPAAALTPGGDFLLVVNATDSTVHVIDTLTDAEVDTDPNTTGINPVLLTKNSNLKDIVVTEVTNPSDTYAFVSGSSGISVIDLNIGLSSFGTPKVLDLSDDGSNDTTLDPMVVSSPPGHIVASSKSDGYVYTSTSNANVSVVTEKPFVTISSTSLGTSSLTTGGSFTVTFKSTATGAYRVLLGGSASADGTELTTGTVSTANTDTTTPSISFDASKFSEGTNRLFVFVTDSSSKVGRDAVDIKVDTPPLKVDIESTSFGSGRVYVTFDRLTASDIHHYNIYVDTDAATVLTKKMASTSVSQPTSGTEVTASVGDLINGTVYFIGVEGVDAAGNLGTRNATLVSGSAAKATPERTIGLAEQSGETGCSLIKRETRSLPSRSGILWLFFGLIILAGGSLFYQGRRILPVFLFLIFFFLLTTPLNAQEDSPRWWTLELKGGVWIPTPKKSKDFLGTCCDPTGKMEFGFLYRSKFGIEFGAGYVGASGRAISATSGAFSQDTFSLILVPLENNLTFRANFVKNQLFVPYVKAGPDYVIFRENSQGKITNGVKTGLHAAAGVEILMNTFETVSSNLEDASTIKDVYFVMEGRYAWVNGFGGNGVDLSNLMFTGGFLFGF